MSPAGELLADRVAARARERPGAPAIRDAGGTLSHRRLAEHVFNVEPAQRDEVVALVVSGVARELGAPQGRATEWAV